MSVINQTLRALDARALPGTQQAPLRAVAPRAKRRTVWWLAGVGVLVGAAVAAWWLAQPAVTAAPVPVALPVQTMPTQSTQAEPLAVVAAAPEAHAAVEPQADAQVEEGVVQAAAAHATDLVPRTMPPAADTTPVPAEPARLPLIQKQLNPVSTEEAAEERYRKAVTLLQKGRDAQARPLLEDAIALHPGHVAAWQTLAALLSEAGRLVEAEAVLRAGRAAVPGHAWFALSLARLQAGRGDVRQAVATLQEGLGARGVEADYHATLAALLVQLDQHGGAVQHYRQALAAQPGESTWWVGLGLALSAQGQSREARAAYERALATGGLSESLTGFVRAKLAE